MTGPSHIGLGSVLLRGENLQVELAVQAAHHLRFERINVVDMMLDAGLPGQAGCLNVKRLNRFMVDPRWRSAKFASMTGSRPCIDFTRIGFPIESSSLNGRLPIFIEVAYVIIAIVVWMFLQPLQSCSLDLRMIFNVVICVCFAFFLLIPADPVSCLSCAAVLAVRSFPILRSIPLAEKIKWFGGAAIGASLSNHGSFRSPVQRHLKPSSNLWPALAEEIT